MPNYAQGDTRITLSQTDVIAGQNNGSLVIDSQRTRPYWFDGRFLAARDLEREQDYFLQRQADLGQAAGFGVIHGLWVDTPAPNDPNAGADTVIIRAGQGLTPACPMSRIWMRSSISRLFPTRRRARAAESTCLPCGRSSSPRTQSVLTPPAFRAHALRMTATLSKLPPSRWCPIPVPSAGLGEARRTPRKCVRL